MIELTNLANRKIWVNPHRIEMIEANPDTTLVFVEGNRIVVRESVDEVLARIVRYRRSIGHSDGGGE